MNLDEFSFFNQQLAGMLNSGVPLEGALRQLCSSMRDGGLKAELETLASDLANGVPLGDALPRRRLPQLYIEVVQIGAKANNLPATLLLLADYYRKRHSIWLRLKAMMVYPGIVLVSCLALSAVLAWLLGVCQRTFKAGFLDVFEGYGRPAVERLGPWAVLGLPVMFIFLLTVLFVLAISLPAFRDWCRWRLPGFRESSLSQLAWTLKLLVAGGNDLGRSLSLLVRLEGGTRLGRELGRWQERMASGKSKFGEFAAGSTIVPPLFVWLVGQSGESIADGLGHAAEIFGERAKYRTEMLLYAALPVAVIFLGSMILFQAASVARSVVMFINLLGG